MRYFFYRKPFTTEKTAVIVDENSSRVILFPTAGRNYYSIDKSTWISYYKDVKLYPPEGDQPIFEICENQFKKFKEKGVIPTNWDW